jgi:collagen type III alpha
MATSPDQVHGHQYVDFDEYIDIQLRKTSSTIKTTDVMTAVVGVLTLITLYLLLFVICDHWLVPGGIGPVARSVMLGVVGSIACVWMAIKVLVPWRRRVSGLYAASTIEKASPALKSSLINLVDISRSGHEVSPEIYQSIERRAALALTHVDVNETVDRRSLLRLSNALLAVVVLFCLYWIFSPKNPGTSLWRAMVPSSEVGVATRTEIFNVHPGDKDVLARSQLEVTADIRGELPQQTFLYFTTADRKFFDERVEMRMENEGTRKFRCVLTGDNGGGILQNMTYRIIAGDATTPEYKIRVIQPPAATIDSIRLDSPEYTRRESVTQTTGAIDALEGTRARLKAHANMPLRSASLQFFDDESATKRAEEIPLMITDGTKLQVDWKLEIRSDGTYPHYYRIFCTSTEGESDPSPSLYNYAIRPDVPPEITLRDPKTDLELPSNAVLPLVIEARDSDFALTYIDLIIEKDGSPVPLQNVYSGNDQQVKTTHRWQFKDYQFKPKDTITYWLEAKDNRQPVANVSRTPKLRIHITAPVSEEQVKKQLAMNEQRQKDEAKKVEAEQPPPEKSDDEKAADNRDGQHQKQPKQKGQNAARKQGQDEKPQANGKPDQTDSDPNSQDQQPGKTAGDKDDTPQGQKAPADKDENDHEKLDPDKPQHDAKAIEKLYDKLIKPHPPGVRPDPLSGGLGDQDKADQKQNNQEKPDQSQSDQKKPDQSKADQHKSDQNSGPQDQKQPGSSSDPPQKSENGDTKPDKANEKPNPSDGSKPGNQQNGDEKADAKEKSDGQSGSKGQSAKPGEEKQDSHGTRSQGDQGQRGKAQGDKPSEMKKDGGRPGAQPDPKNPQQPGGEKGQQEPQKGSPQGSRENKEQGNQQDGQGGQNSKVEKQKGDNSGQEKQSGEKNSQDEKGQGQNSENSKGQKPDQSQPNSVKPGDKQDGAQDGKTPPKNQEGASDSGNDANKQPNKNGDQAQNGNQNGNQPGDEKGKDGSNKNGTSQNQSQKNGSQDNGSQENNSPNNDGNPANRKPGENGGQKPSEKQTSSNESGKREPGKKADGQKGSTKESADNSRERGENGPKEPGEKTGQASRKTDRDPNRQPNQNQTGNPNGDQQQKDKTENSDAASGQDTKAGKERRRRNNPVDPKTPESNRRPLDDQPNTVRDKKNQTGTAGSETDPSHASQKEGTPQQGSGDEQGRKQQTDKTGGQGQPERGGEQKAGDAQNKPGGSQEQPGSKEESGGKDGQPKPGGSKEGQPQADQGQPGQGQQAQGKEGQKGAQGKGNEGASGSGGKGQGNPSGTQANKPGAGLGEGNQGHNGGGFNKGNGSGAGGPLEDTTSHANLEYAKKATDLVLNKLESQLQRGKIDKKIEEEMGWNKDQVRRFVERMRKEAQAAQDPNSPASEARRLQFEETLKSLNLRSTARIRTSKEQPKNNDAEIGSNRSVPPPEYRDLYDAYTRSLAKQAPRQSDSKK